MTLFDSNDRSNNPLSDEAFMAMIEAYDYPAPRRGDIIQGEILSLNENELLLNVGAKRTASVPAQELRDLGGTIFENLSIGDEIQVYVAETPRDDEELIVSVEKILVEHDWEKAQAAFDSKEMVDLRIIGQNGGGLLAEFGRIRGFIPNSKLPDCRHVSNKRQLQIIKEKLIGSRQSLQVIDIDRKKDRLVLSGTESQEILVQKEMEELTVGQKVSGTVVALKPYGIFVSFGHLTGLCHISKLAHQQIDHPKALFNTGDEIEVIVDEIDREKGRISLNRKTLLPSPYEAFAKTHALGDLVEGEIQNVVDFGTFIQLDGGIVGLMHVNEMVMVPGSHPTDVWQKGERVLVSITQIDVEGERIGLSQRKVDSEAQIKWMMENEA